MYEPWYKNSVGSVVPACTYGCVRINTMNKFMEHLAQDVLAEIMDEIVRRTAIAES